MPEMSALGPIDPSSVSEVNEEEKSAPWIARKLVGVSSHFSKLSPLLVYIHQLLLLVSGDRHRFDAER